jgi:hypothetical protein
MAEIKVGVRTADSHTGVTSAGDLVKAIRTAVAGLVMKRGLPGAFSTELKEGALQGVIEFHAQPSEASGQMMYYGQGKDMHIGELKGLNVGISIMFPKTDLNNFVDDDTLKLYKAAKTVASARTEKDYAKITPEQVKLLGEHGVTVDPKLLRK